MSYYLESTLRNEILNLQAEVNGLKEALRCAGIFRSLVNDAVEAYENDSLDRDHIEGIKRWATRF